MTQSLGTIEVKTAKLAKARRRIVRLLQRLTSLPASLLRRHGGQVTGGDKRIPWDARAEELGAYSVIDTTHSPEEYEYVTRRQKEIIYPLFEKMVRPTDGVVLDYGCGPGRFTADLAAMVHGRAVGVDVTAKLIEIAPRHPDVTFVHSKDFFAEYALRFDVIWVCLVLGGIPQAELQRTASEITAALKDDGLLFLVESTVEQPTGTAAWQRRTVQELLELFPHIKLERIGFYYDAKQEISIIAGRKRQAE